MIINNLSTSAHDRVLQFKCITKSPMTVCLFILLEKVIGITISKQRILVQCIPHCDFSRVPNNKNCYKGNKTCITEHCYEIFGKLV